MCVLDGADWFVDNHGLPPRPHEFGRAADHDEVVSDSPSQAVMRMLNLHFVQLYKVD